MLPTDPTSRNKRLVLKCAVVLTTVATIARHIFPVINKIKVELAEGPAIDAGLQPGDEVVGIAGKVVRGYSIRAAKKLLDSGSPGEAVQVDVIRTYELPLHFSHDGSDVSFDTSCRASSMDLHRSSDGLQSLAGVHADDLDDVKSFRLFQGLKSFQKFALECINSISLFARSVDIKNDASVTGTHHPSHFHVPPSNQHDKQPGKTFVLRQLLQLEIVRDRVVVPSVAASLLHSTAVLEFDQLVRDNGGGGARNEVAQSNMNRWRKREEGQQLEQERRHVSVPKSSVGYIAVKEFTDEVGGRSGCVVVIVSAA